VAEILERSHRLHLPPHASRRQVLTGVRELERERDLATREVWQIDDHFALVVRRVEVAVVEPPVLHRVVVELRARAGAPR
jgi:hypothetical protein